MSFLDDEPGIASAYIDGKGVFKLPPPPVGALQITSSFAIPTLVKPARFHLWMMRKMFGWIWVDYKKEHS